MTGKLIGYLRVSTAEQQTDRQLDGIELDKRFEEKISGKDTNRPELKAMLEYIREGDHVFVHELSRLGRSMVDLHKIVEDILKKKASVVFVKENMEFSPDRINDPVKDSLFGMLSVFSQFERSLIKQRQKEGIAAAKNRGKHLGRPIKLTADQKDEIRKRSAAGEKPPELSKAFNVARATIYNVIKG
jgi:DNA invertase Pin-like site-specific DNA recombinase